MIVVGEWASKSTYFDTHDSYPDVQPAKSFVLKKKQLQMLSFDSKYGMLLVEYSIVYAALNQRPWRHPATRTSFHIESVCWEPVKVYHLGSTIQSIRIHVKRLWTRHIILRKCPHSYLSSGEHEWAPRYNKKPFLITFESLFKYRDVDTQHSINKYRKWTMCDAPR